MELNIKFDEKMIVETANKVLDEFEYNGKTIREWADLIANQKTNADRIRAMADEELVFFLWWFADGSGKTKDQWRDWLKQERDNGT